MLIWGDTPDAATAERRRSERSPLFLVGLLHCGEESHSVRTLNASAEGILLETDATVVMGQHCRLTLYAGGRSLHGRGRVVRLAVGQVALAMDDNLLSLLTF